MKSATKNFHFYLSALLTLLTLLFFQNCDQNLENLHIAGLDNSFESPESTSSTNGDVLQCQAISISVTRIHLGNISKNDFSKIIFNDDVIFNSCQKSSEKPVTQSDNRLLIYKTHLEGINDPNDSRLVPQEVEVLLDTQCDGQEQVIEIFTSTSLDLSYEINDRSLCGTHALISDVSLEF